MTAPAFASTSEFAQFKATFSGDLVLPTDEGYRNAIRRWSPTAERPAGIVAYVKANEDVGMAIKFAVKAGLEIAVTGGGHNPSGASSTDGGIVIDLSRYMNQVTCNPDTKIVTVGGGALWASVDNATIPHGLATVGGTVSHTGVGGLTVGGGLGYLTGERGMVVDNLVGATVVIADGTVLHASDKENEDLFWGVRGGGVNFGVVTTFELQCYPQASEVFCGRLVFTPDKAEAVIRAADKLDREHMGPKELVLAGLTGTPAGVMVFVLLFYNGTSEEGRRKYQVFYDLGPVQDDTGSKSYIQLNQIMDQDFAHGAHIYMLAANQSIPPSNCIVPVFEEFSKMIAETPAFQGSLLAFEYIPNDVTRSKADDATAYNCRRFSNNVPVIIRWKDEDSPELRDKARAYAKRIAKMIDPGDGEEQTPYGNYQSDVVSGGVKVRKLFGSNYPRLQRIKAKYDPNMVFNKWFPIVPAK